MGPFLCSHGLVGEEPKSAERLLSTLHNNANETVFVALVEPCLLCACCCRTVNAEDYPFHVNYWGGIAWCERLAESVFADVQIIPPEMDLSQGCLTSYHQAVKSRQYCIQILVVQPGADLFWRNVTQRANSALLHMIGCACQAAGAMARLKALRRKNKSNNSNQHVQHGVACSLKECTLSLFTFYLANNRGMGRPTTCS